MTKEHQTYCRICDSACGLIATVDDGRVAALRPDPDHPLSQGYACRKGTSFASIHHHPDRVTRPRIRTDRAAAFEETSWEEALQRLGDQLATIRDQHGPQAIGIYSGNAAAYGLGAILGATALLDGIGTRKHYSCLTLDNSEMFVVTEACLGNPMLTFVADYENSDCIVLIGTDPLSSQPAQAQTHPSGVRQLLDAARSGRLTVVDPRRSSTARRAAHHLRPKPGSDVALLAWLVAQVLDRQPPADPMLTGVEAVHQAVERFDTLSVSAWTGLVPEQMDALRDRLLQAERPLVWSGLGVLLGATGTVGWWLTLVLQAALQGLDRPGGWRLQHGVLDLPRLFSRFGVPGRNTKNPSRIGGWPAILGTHAAATLASDILTPGDGQLRALIVVGGNPADSLPDTRRAQEALAALDLLVVVDLFQTPTADLGHAVLPARSWLSREDLPLHTAHQRPIPHLQWAEAVADPIGEAREDWDILCGLCVAMGRPLFGSRVASAVIGRSGMGPAGLASLALTLTAPGLRRRLRRGRTGVVASTGRSLAERGSDHRDGRIHLAIPEFLAALDALIPDAAPADDHLQLLTSVRPPASMNWWMGTADNTATLHPADAERLEIVPPGPIRVSGSTGGHLETAIRLDPHQRRGVIIIPFGQASCNPNRVIGTETLEPFTGQPISNGAWVRVSRVP